jgi:DNA repair exonuclease SbcCD ATPase subunit
MKLKFKTKNTLAFGEKGIEFDLSEPGLFLVTGKHLSSSSKTSNGVGKSSILDTLLWGLYGSKPSGRLKSDIVNDSAEGDSVTEVVIEKGGKVGEIIRTISANEFERYGVPVVGDELAFFIDEEDMRGDSMKATQELITSFIGLDEESFKASAWFTADKESFADKTPAQQDKLFLKLLKLGILKKAREVVKNKLDKVSVEIQGQEREIGKKQAAIEEIDRSIEKAKQEIQTWKRQQKIRIQSAKEAVDATTTKLVTKKEELKTCLASISELQKQIDDFEEVDSEQIEKLEQEKQKLQAELSNLNEDLGKIKGNISIYRKALKSAQSLESGTRCPKCGSELDEEHLYDYRKELNDNISKERSGQEDLEAEIVDIRESIEGKREKITQLRSISTQKKEIEHSLQVKQSQKKSIEEAISSLEERLSEKQSQLKQLESEKPPQQASTKDYETRREALAQEIEGLESDRLTLLRRQENLEFWKHGFGPEGLRNLLVRSAIPALDKNASRFSKVLTNGELSIRFSGTSETSKGETRNKLSVKATDIYGSDKYAKSSGGERRRIDLCVDLALHFLVEQRTGLPFLFVDEIFTKLDSAGKEKVLDLLRVVNEEIPSIFVISNQDDIVTTEFDKVITVYRKDKQSWIEKE